MMRSLRLGWLASVIAMMVTAGSSWYDLLLVPDAGSQQVAISGYQVFPIISALLLLQGAAILVSLLTPPTVTRWVAAGLAVLQAWHLIATFFGATASIETAAASKLSELTGVTGQAQQQLVEAASSTDAPIFYLIALGVNVVALLLNSLLSPPKPPSRSNPEQSDDSSSLWESQS